MGDLVSIEQQLIAKLKQRGQDISSADIYLLRSNSMFPTLRLGDFLVLQRVSENKINKGDIVAYRKESREAAIVHRVIGKNPALGSDLPFLLKGDNLFAKDSTTEKDKLLGRLAYLYRGQTLIDYQRPLRRQFNKFMAIISQLNLLPELLKRRLGKLFIDWLRESSLLISATDALCSKTLQVEHFEEKNEQQKRGNLKLLHCDSSVGGIFYRGHKDDKDKVEVECFWLRFPFSYKKSFAQLLTASEKTWQELGFKSVEWPFYLERQVIRNFLQTNGYQELTTEEGSRWQKNLSAH